MPRRVAVTGIGVITGLGVGIRPLWDALLAGTSCLAPIRRFDPSGFPCRLGGEVKDFVARDHVPKHYRKAVKVMARDTELAVGAARLAVEDAGLVTRAALGDPADTNPAAAKGKATYPGARMGCHIGAGLVAADVEELTAALVTARGAPDRDGRATVDLAAWGRAGMENLTPLWLLKYLPNMLACHVTILHGAEGPSNTITCAEASGLLSIGESMRIIERGAADLCFSGGAESKINLMGLLRMDLAGRLAHTGDAVEGAGFVRPYDASHARAADPRANGRGGLLGEGAGILILEELGAAAARGARVYAELAGFGAAQSSPWYDDGENDEGYRFAVEAALEDAGIGPDEVDAIAPLASGIPQMDRPEEGALRAVFGDRLARIPLITLCGQVGNCMAGAGGVQAGVAAMCVAQQRLPARLHAGTPGDGLLAGAAPATPASLRYVLVCTGAMGGQNAALVLKRAATV